MADLLLSWLRSVPAARRALLSEGVDGNASALSELARRLRDPHRVESLLAKMGEGARRTMTRLSRASEPLRRDDLASLEGADGAALLESMEASALVFPVDRADARSEIIAPVVRLPAEASHAASHALTDEQERALVERSHRRELEWALLLGRLCQQPPRITRSGELHAADVKALAVREDDRLSAGWVTSSCGALFEAGALGIDSGRVRPTLDALADPIGTLRRVIWQALMHALRDDQIRALLAAFIEGEVWALGDLRDACEQRVLAARASSVERPRGSCRREVESLVGSLLSHPAFLVISPQHAPEATFVAMDRAVIAPLRGQPPAPRATRTGFVLPSFEAVATAECDPVAVACVAACGQLLQLDHAVRWQLTPESVARGGSAGVTPAMLSGALETLSGGRVDVGVVRSVMDWISTAATPVEACAPMPVTAENVLIQAVQHALHGTTEMRSNGTPPRDGARAGRGEQTDDLDPLDDLLDAPTADPARR